MHTKDLGLSSRAYNALSVAGIKSLDQLQRLDSKALEGLRGVGPQTHKEIMGVLATHQASADTTQ